ncbi:MAG: hypothetical protein A2Z14_04255 [Chloroflexi bacterium RBG_16_48_8]|nr:MAG: hypothetical protein A2Z14_04255 [Chloroflexi bacterium RBG_16_48_8]
MKWLRRIVWGITGIVWFLWLGYEDRSLTSVIAVAALIAFALGLEVLAKWTQKRPVKPTLWLLRCILIGAFAGAIVGPIIVVLAVGKISLHHHPTPDFELAGMRMLMGKSLTWIAAGALFGAAGGFLKLSQK